MNQGPAIHQFGKEGSGIQHEYQHYLDDKAAGFRGMSGLLDSNFRVGTEANAYLVEITRMQEMGHPKIVKKLAENFKAEMENVTGKFGDVTEAETLAKIEKILEVLK